MPAYANKFESPKFIEEGILDKEDKRIGTIRIKPSSILWKPVGQQKFYSVSLDDFTKWIASSKTAAKRVGS